MRYCPVIVFVLICMFASCQNKNDSSKPRVISQEELIGINKKLVDADMAKIRSFAKKENWNYVELDNGLIYEVLMKGEGEKASPKDQVLFSYQLLNLEKEIIYSSEDMGLRKFSVDFDEVEAGLNQIAKISNQGDSLRVLLPPHLAFGLAGDGKKVPQRSCLLYYLKLVEILDQN